MYDELTRIESIYGSVAEYNRVREEEENYYEPTEEELYENEVKHKVYSKQIELLDGTPSELAVKLKAEWKTRAPKQIGSAWTTVDHYNAIKFDKEMKFSILNILCKHYNILLSKESYFKTKPNSFGISLEYHEDSMIKNINICDIFDYTTFQNFYRDLYYIFTWLSLCYCDTKGEIHTISNTSLGGLRNSYFKSWGLEDEGSQKKELQTKGFDEKEYELKIRESGLRV